MILIKAISHVCLAIGGGITLSMAIIWVLGWYNESILGKYDD